MDKRREEKLLRFLVRILFLIFLASIVLHFLVDLSIPGFSPLAFCLFWLSQWRLFYIRGLFPGKIYTFIYLLIAVLSLFIAFNQISETIA